MSNVMDQQVQDLNGETPDVASLIDQTIMTGAGLTTRGLGLVRVAVGGLFDASDRLVEGVLSTIDSWTTPTPIGALTQAPLSMVRDSWSIGRDASAKVLLGATPNGKSSRSA